MFVWPRARRTPRTKSATCGKPSNRRRPCPCLDVEAVGGPADMLVLRRFVRHDHVETNRRVWRASPAGDARTVRIPHNNRKEVMSDPEPTPIPIEFDCLPLRSVAGRPVPADASPGLEQLWQNLEQAAEKHGLHNSYFLHRGRCEYRMTNHGELGRIIFHFSGTVLTDKDDQRTVGSDLTVVLAEETCDWLEQAVVVWFTKSVARAVEVEFDRFIQAGDLARTQQRLAEIEQQTTNAGGYLGMYL